eukprot:TRINITY_DN156_c2_g1_i1.p1 TRINITY_DN156_c2_g1~~TRINITY_DN156_c2_g1_i1.p1  ORF type:complete len:486 (+),score=143.53 TRINITY_DN156_c2_g1_i1:98-1555(+)
MKIVSLAILVLAVVSSTFADDVVVVGKGNFEEVVKNNAYVLMEFYAPWCGHCKRLEPEYSKAASTLKGEVVLAKVDATVETELASQHGVSGYPTIKFFKNGKVANDYDGERTAEGIAAWCRKKSGPAATPVADQAGLDAWKSKTKDSASHIIAFVGKDSKEEKKFLQVANDPAVDEFSFAVVHDESVATTLGASKFPSIILTPSGGEALTYDGLWDDEDILAWALKNGFPLVEELSQNVWKRASASKRSLVVGFYLAEEAEQSISLLTNIAKALKQDAAFSISDNNKFPNMAEQWGASGNKWPVLILVIWGDGGNPKFKVWDESNDLTVESGSAWVDGCIKGDSCPSFLKSEPVPENNNGPVKVVVGKNFAEIVMDEEKDVFVEFYAPWCGHCKKLAPIWDQLGEKFANVPSVTIAKTDATANAFPDNIEVRGYPTLLFFPAGSKTPVTYNEDRNLEKLTEFVLKTAAKPIDQAAFGGAANKDEL